jgi:phosphopantetheinyl transferase (holo-ACP synthase)
MVKANIERTTSKSSARTGIDVRDDEQPRPTIRVTGRAKETLAGRKVYLSISHLPDYATTSVVVEDWPTPEFICRH